MINFMRAYLLRWIHADEQIPQIMPCSTSMKQHRTVIVQDIVACHAVDGPPRLSTAPYLPDKPCHVDP